MPIGLTTARSIAGRSGVPEGSVIADAYDCEFDPVYVNYDGLAVSGPTTVELSG